MQYPKLFEHGRIGRLETRNRIVVSPLNTGYAQGYRDRWWHGERHRQVLSRWAKGGAGLIIQAHVKVECEIDKEGPLSRYMVLDRDDWISGLTELTDDIHRRGAKIAIQLSAGCGRIAQLVPGHQPVSASANPHFLDPTLMTRELSISEIERLVEAFGKASARAKTAGFDAIHVHCLSQLFDQFLTPRWNRRTDRYGGDVEGRMRFVLECIESAKSYVGDDFPIIVGMVSNHKVPGGNTPEDSIRIAKRFEAAGVHALHLRAGGYDAPQWLNPPMFMEDACSIPYALPIKEAVRIPVIVDGKIRDPATAESLLEQGRTDFVGLCRPMVADPDWPKKARAGRAEQIRKCIACNECLTRIQQWAPLGCSVNPDIGRDEVTDGKESPQPRRVIVIGGGPAGMKAASVAASRGHRVRLFEKEDELGGHLIEAAAPSFKRDIASLLDHLKRCLEDTSVEVVLGQEVTSTLIAVLRPDVVIVATGSKALIPDIPGVRGDNVATAIAVLRGKAEVGERVAVLGGNAIGCETALHLARNGHKVTIVRRGLEPYPPDVPPFQAAYLTEALTSHGVEWITGVDVKEIPDHGIILLGEGGKREWLVECDSTVLARGLVSEASLVAELESQPVEVYAIGDCLEPRKIWEAIHEGAQIGKDI